VLHTVNKSPFERDSAASCLRHAAAGSAVLLLEDGIYAALRGTTFEPTLRAVLGRARVYVLGPDLAARGMEPARLVEGIEVVDYDGFVDLVVAHDKVQAWL